MASEDKKKALDAAIAKLEKDFGKGTVMKLGDPKAQVHVETIPTGSLSLDLALGLGGVPRGRVVEVYGPESSGKTTVALHMIAEVQKRGGIAGFIDAEHALDPVYAKNIGVDIDELYISQPDSGDQALEIAETMVRSGAMDIIVPGAEKADSCHQQVQLCGDLYQPAQGESWRYVWQSRDHDRRTRAEVLRFRPHGCEKDRDSEAGRRDRRKPRAREDREEQDRTSLQRGRV